MLLSPCRLPAYPQNHVCPTPFCPCSAVSQPHPQNNKSFGKQCHSAPRRRCTVKSGKFPVWRTETCPRGSSRQCSHLSTEPVSSAPRTPWQGQGQSVVGKARTTKQATHNRNAAVSFLPLGLGKLAAAVSKCGMLNDKYLQMA